jgi:hypothetical protein
MKPNIIYIYADDLGRGMLSCYGQRHFRTPNIDRIAGEGLRFESAYGCAFCAPSRASLLTGAHDCHRGGWTFTQGGPYDLVTSGRLTVNELSELIHTVSLEPPPPIRSGCPASISTARSATGTSRARKPGASAPQTVRGFSSVESTSQPSLVMSTMSS